MKKTRRGSRKPLDADLSTAFEDCLKRISEDLQKFRASLDGSADKLKQDRHGESFATPVA